MADHDLFIEQLSRTIEPVKRPWQPGWRVVAWIVMALPCGALASLLVQNLHRLVTDRGCVGYLPAISDLSYRHAGYP
jgi:hypothetical protein